MIYGAEAWDVSRKNRNNLLTVEMDYLRSSCRWMKLNRIQNETVKLIWFGRANGVVERVGRGKC
jgi:hypothetical protein